MNSSYPELLILLPLLPKCCDYRCVQSHHFHGACDQTWGSLKARPDPYQPSPSPSHIWVFNHDYLKPEGLALTSGGVSEGIESPREFKSPNGTKSSHLTRDMQITHLSQGHFSSLHTGSSLFLSPQLLTSLALLHIRASVSLEVPP